MEVIELEIPRIRRRSVYAGVNAQQQLRTSELESKIRSVDTPGSNNDEGKTAAPCRDTGGIVSETLGRALHPDWPADQFARLYCAEEKGAEPYAEL